ncbi:50S ribosomal protein L15 [Candidatus Gracilibacteria bacterium]|nr:50S ribosomal protein L15 [Candidatus Gracilibacteria bacterium]
MLSTKTITPNTGSRKKSKRVGRGNASGKGTFCGRGMNGQNSRSGGGVPDWFEGGQTPLFRRMPKLKGFSNARYTKHFNVLNLSDIQKLADSGVSLVNKEVLLEKNIIRKKGLPVKLLGNGELSSKVEIHVDAASASAVSAIEKSGGSLTLIPQTAAI